VSLGSSFVTVGVDINWLPVAKFAGRLPIHWAIERLLPLPALVCIDDANPVEGASKPDHRGTCYRRCFHARRLWIY
jgi:hypothetical protein